MIISGYQGIGKSSLAGSKTGFIDLESSNFWVNGVRDKNWAEVYANIAVHLTQQGFNVFTSVHKEVREALHKHPYVQQWLKENVPVIAVCYPEIDLKESWLQKLEARYRSTKLDKDFKAWKSAEVCFDDHIADLKASPVGVLQIPIENNDYVLPDLLAQYGVIALRR